MIFHGAFFYPGHTASDRQPKRDGVTAGIVHFSFLNTVHTPQHPLTFMDCVELWVSHVLLQRELEFNLLSSHRDMHADDNVTVSWPVVE